MSDQRRHPGGTAGYPVRKAALALLEAVLGRRRPLEEALDALPGRLDRKSVV